MIPKKIHYCWFGNNPKPEIIEKCIDSWKHFCPGWEIVEWNDTNYDIASNSYMYEAYQSKKWAFVSDVARLDLIYRYGGIYLDTDVELLSSIDHWLEYGAFVVFETELNVSTGLGFGAVQGHPAVKAMLEQYDNKHFVMNGKKDLSPCPAFNTAGLRMLYPIVRNGKTQILNDVAVFSHDEYSKIAKHYGTATWSDGPKQNKNPVYKNSKLKRFLKRPQKFDFIQRHFGERGLRIYSFLVYDLYEFGPIYYIKRIFWKVIKR